MIDVNKWGIFRVGDLFDIHPTAAYKMTNKELMNDEGSNPIIVNSGFNNGVGGFTDQKCTEKAGVITFTDTAAKSSESFFYQDEEFVGYPHVQGMYSKYHKLNVYEGEFIVTALRCAAGKFDFINKMTRDEVLEFNIKLPITPDGQPDWDYMESYMKAVMEKSKKSLEKLEKAADTKFIIDVSRWGKFSCRKLFSCKNTGNILARDVEDGSGTTPFVTASGYNNGVAGYIDASKFEIIKGHCILVGGKTFTITYQKDDFVSNDSHNFVIRVKDYDISDLSYLYLVSTIYAYFGQKYSWSDAVTKDKLMDDIIPLPMNTNGDPDWQFMEDYMKQVMDKAEQQINDLCLVSK